MFASTTGSDANSGLTLADPVASIARAIEVLGEKGWNRLGIVTFAPGNYAIPAGQSYNFKSTGRGSNEQLVLLRGGLGAAVLTDSVASFTVGANTGMVDIAPSGAIAADAYNGIALRWTSGALAGQFAQIGRNTATAISLLSASAPAIGDTFEIVPNEVSFTCPGAMVFEGNFLAMQNIDLYVGNGTVNFIVGKLAPDNLQVRLTPAASGNLSFFRSSLLFSQYIGVVFEGFGALSQNLGIAITDVPSGFNGCFVSMQDIYANNAPMSFSGSQVYMQALCLCNNSSFSVEGGQGYLGGFTVEDLSGNFLSCNSTSMSISNFAAQRIAGTFANLGAKALVSFNSGSVDTVGGFYNSSDAELSISDITVSVVTANTNNAYDSSIRLNNFTYTGVMPFSFTACGVTTDNVVLTGISSGSNAWDLSSCLWHQDGSFSFVNCNPSGSPALRCTGCSVEAQMIVSNNSGNINMYNTSARINSYHPSNVAGPQSCQLTNTSLMINDYSLDGAAPETSDVSWYLDGSAMRVGSWKHDGPVSSYLVSLRNSSTLTLQGGAIVNTRNRLIDLFACCSFDLQNLDVSDASQLAVSDSTLRYARISNVSDGGVNTAPTGPFIQLTGGQLYMDNCSITASAGINQIQLTSVNATLNNNTLTENSPSALITATNCTFVMSSGTLNETAGTGIILNSCSFSITNATIYAVTTGISLLRCSKGYLDGITGGSGAYGVDLMSGSSFSNGGSNNITGVSGDVQVGAAGSFPWGGLTTNDFAAATPAYVTITPP